MVDNLPLIPSKEGVCADVRPVLREVFRELDYLPPLATEKIEKPHAGGEDCLLPKLDHWVENYKSECKQLWIREDELKQQRAKSISRKPLANKYKLQSRKAEYVNTPDWNKDFGILGRKDLMPSIKQSAGGERSMWVKNILNRSSCDASSVELRGSRVRPPIQLYQPDNFTLQSVSIGELAEQPLTTTTPPPPEIPQPEYIVCVPPRLDFVNFTVGQLHTQSIRLVNVSKLEIRLSIRPPSRKELDVELGGTRGLTVTSGAAAELRIHFRPANVRVLRDHLLVRVSVGKDFVVPIYCYMQPPILEILVPSLASATLSCTPGGAAPCALESRGSDVLELGARLLGDVHRVTIMLHCDATHAQFFVLTEDDWISFCLDEVRCDGSVVSGWFSWWPARWAGGGVVRALAACRAPAPGLHAAPLRLLASTAVVRPLHLLADALLFSPSHISIQAQEKDYDICSEDDPACEYFVHLGTAFPGRSLTATVQLINHSPVLYSYYWSVRAWGTCSCAHESDDNDSLCAGAAKTRRHAQTGAVELAERASAAAAGVRVSPGRGAAPPRSARALHVAAPHVGTTVGTSRAVLMLVLKDIPKESFPADYDPMIVSTKVVESESIPGFQCGPRCVCDVVCCELEVWWDVAPVRFVLDPPVVPLSHSLRVQQVDVVVRATQLFGCEAVRGAWLLPSPATPATPAPRLTPATSCATHITISLPPMPHQRRETDVITLVADNEEWRSECKIWRECGARHVSVRPAFLWLGLVPPGTHVSAMLRVHNDTHQQAEWQYRAFRWIGENEPSAVCAGRAPCPQCHERACSCALLRATRRPIPHGAYTTLQYDVNAPERDGCVSTVVRAWSPGSAVPAGASAGASGDSAALAYRVLAPRVVLRVLPCRGDRHTTCEGCDIDGGAASSARGTGTLRPARALCGGRRACCRLALTNTTPLHTAARWHPPIDGDDILKVTFTPNEVEIASYEKVEIQVVLEPRKVCARRIFVYKATVDNAYKPIYLIIDTAIAGVEVTCEIPLGGAPSTDESVCIRRSQREDLLGEDGEGNWRSPADIFLEEDRRREQQTDKTCYCPYEMVYFPPVKRPAPPSLLPEDYTPSIEIVDSPPPLTRVCPCCRSEKPVLPDLQEPICLQFTDLPIRTVGSRRVTLRSACELSVRWSCAVRRWPRAHTRTLDTDQWAVDVCESGVALQVAPSSGVLAPRGGAELLLSVYAATWGLYRDQILIQIEKVEPIVLDVWVEAVGAPLHFPIKPPAEPHSHAQDTPVIWMCGGESRALVATNSSCAPLSVRAYTLLQHQDERDRLPFRLYIRLYDVPPRSCPCLTACDSDYGIDESSEQQSSIEEEMDTAVELYLAADYGLQHDTPFMVEPRECVVGACARAQWRVSVAPGDEPAQPAALLLRLIPTHNTGECWHRPEPPPQLVQLRECARVPILQASRDRLCVRLCALNLPLGDMLRVRKCFHVKNVGDGPLRVCARTQAPWSVALGAGGARGHCACTRGGRGGCGGRGERSRPATHHRLDLWLPPRSSTEICVEVSISAADASPVHTVATTTVRLSVTPELDAEAAGQSVAPLHTDTSAVRRLCYEPLRRSTTPLRFYDQHNMLLQIPLTLELEFPVLTATPDALDFGFVADGDVRKTYFTVSHSSRTETLRLETAWEGGAQFRLWPTHLSLAPGHRAHVYVQYTARWCGAPVEGCARVCCVSAAGAAPRVSGARAWCVASVRCRAAPARDLDCRRAAHDHTDDSHLLPV